MDEATSSDGYGNDTLLKSGKGSLRLWLTGFILRIFRALEAILFAGTAPLLSGFVVPDEVSGLAVRALQDRQRELVGN